MCITALLLMVKFIVVSGKLCPKCQELKEAEDFTPRRRSPTGLSSWCKKCSTAGNQARRKANPLWHKAETKKHRVKLKAELLQIYGNKCTCCGEAESDFLTLEHINEDGHKDRKESGGQLRIMRRLRKAQIPIDGYTILCFNCNCAKAFFGSCPHQRRNND